MKKINLLIICLVMMILSTSCLKRDDLEDITIYTTTYPIEFLASELYGYNSEVKSIYPDGIDVNEYKLTSKQVKDYSQGEIFIYNGLSNEKKIAADFINKNEDLIIIDVSQGIELNHSMEELWLSPSNYLMLAQNIKNRLKEHISNKYIREEIDENYENLKINISEIDAELKIIAENAVVNTLIVSNDVFKFLEKYGYEVISLEGEVSSSTLNKIRGLFDDGKVNNIFVKEGEKMNETVTNLQNNNKAKIVTIKTITTLTDEERKNKDNYITIMKSNVEAIRNEVLE